MALRILIALASLTINIATMPSAIAKMTPAPIIIPIIAQPSLSLALLCGRVPNPIPDAGQFCVLAKFNMWGPASPRSSVPPL
jgi:hypothetical protein